MVVLFAIVSSVVNDNFDNVIFYFNFDLNILIIMLETELGSSKITDIIPSEYWFKYSSYLSIF